MWYRRIVSRSASIQSALYRTDPALFPVITVHGRLDHLQVLPAAQAVLAKCLDLMGMAAPERM